MPVSGVIDLADANVWLALAFSDHAHHAKAKAWFDVRPDDSSAFCRVTQMALLRHLTNSTIMGPFVQTQQGAWKAYDCLAQDPRTVFLGEPRRWRSSSARLPASPRRRMVFGPTHSSPLWRWRVRAGWSRSTTATAALRAWICSC